MSCKINIMEKNDITGPVNRAIDNFKNNPSILLIQSKFANDST